MSQIERMLAIPDATELARALVVHLSLPMGPSGPNGPTPPEHDIIDHLRSSAASSTVLHRLTQSVAEILEEAEIEVACGDRSPSLFRLVARLGYMCTSLRLSFDADQFFRIGHGLAQTARIECRTNDRDLFQILRTIGRSPGHGRTDAQSDAFWTSFLDHPLRGIRTIAAQNLVRGRSGVRAALYIRDILDSDVNEGIVAREWLKAAGSVDSLLRQVGFLPGDTLRRLAAALRSAGEDHAAQAIDNSVGALPVQVVIGPGTTRAGRVHTFGGRMVRVGAPYRGLLAGDVAGPAHKRSDEAVLVASRVMALFRGIKDPPDLDQVRALQSNGQMQRLQLSVG